MLKCRVIPTLLLKEVGLVKGKQFNNARRVGSLLPAIKVYNNREVDELILFDVSATPSGQSPDFEHIASVTQFCLMPLTVGGGITQIEHIQNLLKLGVDKVAINSAAYAQPAVIQRAANKFGSQCIVAGIDVKKTPAGYECFSHNGTKNQNRDPVSWAKELEALGAGEILITSIDRDGTMQGYDLEIIAKIATCVRIPTIASGGAGNPEHMHAALQQGASAVAAASIFHFTEQTPLSVKDYLSQQGVSVRSIVG